MIVERHGKDKIKLVQRQTGYGVIYAYDIFRDNKLIHKSNTPLFRQYMGWILYMYKKCDYIL